MGTAFVGRDGKKGKDNHSTRGLGADTKLSTVWVWPQEPALGGCLGLDCAVVRVDFLWALVALGRTEGARVRPQEGGLGLPGGGAGRVGRGGRGRGGPGPAPSSWPRPAWSRLCARPLS